MGIAAAFNKTKSDRYAAFWKRIVIQYVLSLGLVIVGASVHGDTIYLDQVKPILQHHCYRCHGGLKQEGNLRLDTVTAMLRGGDSGSSLEPGQVEASLLWQRLTETDAALRMPAESAALSSDELSVIHAWIAAGAAAPVEELPEPGPRDHWSFRAVQRPAIPRTMDGPSGQNPIDAFVEARLRQEGLEPLPTADAATLLRRVYLDLVGLPPTLSQLEDYLADSAPTAYEDMVDSLLSSPAYGERWARHWMDVWRYADWHGRRMVPDVWNSAPQIWRWRDWIVDSLNRDLGYHDMLRLMLAADELQPTSPEALAATGYLVRNWYALNPNDWMRSNVEHTGKAFLGLTFHCAHCHDHKYDPVTQEDYFHLRAYFEPLGMRQDRLAGELDPGPFQQYDYSTLRKIVRAGMIRVFDQQPDAPTWFYTGGDERNRLESKGAILPGVPAVFASQPVITPRELPVEAWYPGLDPGIRNTLLHDARTAVQLAESKLHSMRETPSGYSETVQSLTVKSAQAEVSMARAELISLQARIHAEEAKYLGRNAEQLEGLVAVARAAQDEAELRRTESRLAAARLAVAVAEAKPADEADRDKPIQAAQQQLAEAEMAQANQTSPNENTPRQLAPLSPQYPTVSSGRRSALANWIASDDNPLTPRVAVNHIWLRHFHAPLVTTVFDFGRNGARPTHPELLDWLAAELVESGWSMKHLHRIIVTSGTYRRAAGGQAYSEFVTENQRSDPDNRWLWRMNSGRMEAEVVRDALLGCCGQLNANMGGQELENSEALTNFRRSLYFSCQPENDGTSEFARLFDAPDPVDCYRRSRSIVPQQALALTNSELVHKLSDHLVGHPPIPFSDEVGARDSFINAMFRQILSRPPSADEFIACQEFLTAQRDAKADNSTGEIPTAIERAARSALIRVLFNHNDFVTIR